MFIPIGCDAPLYHRPWGTVGLIALCLLLHVTVGRSEAVEWWILNYGEWSPRQWITSALVHQGWMHLIGNMVFFWVFAQIIEGKIGCWRFLLVVLGIAAIAGAVEQTIMLGADGGSLGLSGVIFGLLAMAWIWAPDNEMDVLILWLPVVRRWDASVSTMGLIYIGLEFLSAALDGFAMSTPMLHLLGAAAGLPIAIIMLRLGWVDCEGWDWFSRHRGFWSRPGTATQRAPTGRIQAPPAPVPPPLDCEQALAAGRLDDALAAWRREGLTTAIPVLVGLAGRLSDAGRWDDAIAVADGILYRDARQDRARLIRAWALVRSGRPRAADQALAGLGALSATDQVLAERIRTVVAEETAKGGMELA